MASAEEFRQACRKIQRYLWDNRQRRVRKAGEAIDALLSEEYNQEACKIILSW